jgi:chromosome segregation ATPase
MELAVNRLADERDSVQRKTFTKWVNRHLNKAGLEVKDLFQDLRDGHKLLRLLEMFTGERLVPEKGRMRFHFMQNVACALKCLNRHQVKVVNIHPEHIVDGNPKITLGLIWTLILHFQISEVIDNAAPESVVSAKESVLNWCQKVTAGYPGVKVVNFTTSWRDGMAFNAIIHRHRPEIIDMPSLNPSNALENLENAFSVAETELNVTRLLDPEDVNVAIPDEKSVMTYVASLWEVFPVLPEPPDETPDAKWAEYTEIASELMEWMEMKIDILDDRFFPDTIPDMEILIDNFEKFKLEELPQKQEDLQLLEQLWNELQILHTQSTTPFSPPQGFNLDRISDTWKTMLKSKNECEIALLGWLERLKRLMAIAEQLKEELAVCESELALLETQIDKGECEWPNMDPDESERDILDVQSALDMQATPLQDMRDNAGILVKESWHEGNYLSSRVQEVYVCWETLCTRLKLFINTKTSTVTLSLQTLQSVDEALQWIRQKKTYIEISQYGSDIDEVQQLSKDHWPEHQAIMDFRSKVRECHDLQSKFAAPCKGLTDLEAKLVDLDTEYQELLVTSEKRRDNLHYAFMYLSHCHSISEWTKNEYLLLSGFDWADMLITMTRVEHDFEQLQTNMTTYRMKLEDCVKEHDNLLANDHPASEVIKECMINLQKKWKFMLKIVECFTIQLTVYQQARQFYSTRQEIEQWLYEQINLLENVYQYENLSKKEAVDRQSNITSLREMVEREDRRVKVLKVQCEQLSPLELRRLTSKGKQERLAIKAIGTFEEFNVEKDDEGVLLEIKSFTEWQVELKDKPATVAPALAFQLLPPSQKSRKDIERVEGLFQRIRELLEWNFTTVEYIVEIIEILEEITVIESWEVDELFAEEIDKRQAIITQMNTRAKTLKPKLTNLLPLATDLGSYNLPDQVARANNHWDTLCCEYAEFEATRDLGQLSDKASTGIEELSNYLILVDTVMVEQKRVAWDISAAGQQESMIKAIAQDVAAHASRYEEIRRWVSAITSKATEEPAGLEKEMNALKHHWETTAKEAHRRQIRIHKSIERLEKYRNVNMPPFVEWLEGAEAHMKKIKKPGKSKEQLDRQIEDHKAFTTTVSEKSSHLDSVIADGKGTMQLTAEFDGLIQLFAARDAKLEPLPSPDQLSTYRIHITNEAQRIAREDNVPSVNPEDYEPCLIINVHENNSQLDQRYKKLKERIERRAEELEEAARYRKNFESAVESLVPWLEEREADVEIEMPSVIEPEAVMQKIEEVEMMENNIMERQSDVEGLQVAADTFMLSLGGQIRPIDNSSDEESDEDDVPDGNTRSAQSKPVEVYNRVASMLAKLSARKAMLQATLPKSHGFLASCEEFEHWLTGVEAKLGSSDPMSLEERKLEVQLLEQKAIQSDISQHKDTLLSLSESGDQVITQTPSEKPNVELKLKSLTNRFNDISDKSESILTDMEKGLPLLDQFNKLYDEISKSTHNIQVKQSSEQPVAIMEEILMQQADENESYRKEINSTSEKLPILESVGDQIVELWTPLLLSRAMSMMNGYVYESSVDLPPLPELDFIHDKVEESKQACKAVNCHATDRHAVIHEALLKVRSFDSMASEFENWLTEKENQEKAFRPFSADVDEFNSKKLVILEFLGDVCDHKQIYETVQDTGISLIAGQDPSDEVQVIQLRLDEIKGRWSNLNDKAAHSKDSLDVIADFREKHEAFINWLAEEEEVVTVLEPVCLKLETLEEQANETEVIQEELTDHQPQYDDLVAAGQAVLDLGEEVDGNEHEKQLRSVEERWDDVAVLIESRSENIQEATGRLKPMEEQYSELIDWVSKASDMFGKLSSQGGQANDHEEDTKAKRETLAIFVAAFTDHEGTYSAVMETGQQLISDFSEADCSPLEEQLDELHYQWTLLKGEECDQLLEVLFDWLECKKKTVANWQPVALYEEPISQQMSELEAFQADLLAYMDEVKIANEKCESLLIELSDSESNEPSLRQQVDDLNEQWDQLNASVAERQTALEDAMEKAKMFSAVKQKLIPWLEEAEVRVSQMTEADCTEGIKEQQARLQQFNEEVAKQKPELDDVVEVGNSLVQGHSPERSDVKEVTGNIEDWTERYNQLNQAIQSYWDNLMDQMSSATQFNDLYDAVVKWLSQAHEEVRGYPRPALTTEGIAKQMEPLEDLEAAVNGKEHEIDSFISKGTELASKIKPPEESTIQAKVSDVRLKWADLQSAVADLKATYISSQERAEKYQTAYNDFDKYLTEQEENAWSLPGIGVRPDDVAQQIEELKALQASLQEHQPDMKEIEQLASDLCEGRNEDDPNKRYVNGSVASHHERFEALKERVDSRLAVGEDCLPKVEKYNKNFGDLIDWLTAFTEQVKNAELVALDPAKIQQQVANMNSLCNQLNSQKTEFDNVVAAGNDVLAIERPKDDPGAAAVMSELSEMQSQFNTNVKALNDRQSLMSTCLPLSQLYHPLVSNLEKWVTSTEEKLAGFHDFPVNPSAVEVELEEIEVIAKDIEDHKKKLDEAKMVGQEFMSCRPEGDPAKEEISSQLQSLDEKFIALEGSASEIAEKLRNALKKAKTMSTDLDDVLQWIGERRKKLENAGLPNVQPEEVEKQIDQHSVFSDSVDNFEPKVNEVCDATRHVLEESTAGGQEFESILEEVSTSWESLKRSTGERKEELNAGLAKAQRFKQMYNEMDNWLDEIEREIDKIRKPAVRPDVLQEQLEACNSLQDRVESQQPVLDSFHTSATDLTNERPDDDPGRSSIESQVQTVDERYNKLKVGLQERLAALESSCGQAEKCDALWAELEPWIDEQKQRQSAIGPVGVETDKLKPQIEECNAVVLAIDECQPKMDEFATLSQNLLESQPPEDETTVAFADRLQNADNLWSALKEEAEEKKKTLEDALSKAEQFEDTLNPLWTWLDEKETEVNGWEPIALDPAVIEQQLVDNEAFNVDVSEHQPLLETVSSAAAALTAKRDEDDPSWSTVNNKVNKAEERFDSLEEAGVRRKEELESTLATSKAFHDDCDDLLGWLVVKADQIEGLDPVEGKPEAIKERIDKLKDHQQALEDQSPNRDRAHTQLKSLIGDRSTSDPAVTSVLAIAAQVDSKFDELAKMLESKLNQLTSIQPLIEKMNTECVDLQDWLKDAQDRLSEMEAVPTALPDIQEKLDKLESLFTETENHQPQMNEMGDGVKQLAGLLNESPEQTASIQSKFDTINAGYEALKNGINSKLKECKASLLQAEGVHASVVDLMDKLKALEARLDAIEPYFVNVEKIKENVDKVEKIQNDLNSLQPEYESAVTAMEEMRMPDSENDQETDDLTSQWEEVKLKLEDMSEDLEAGLSRAEDFQDRLNEVVQWIEKKLAELDGVGPAKATPDAVKGQLQEYTPVFKEIEIYRGDTLQFSSDVREFSARIPDDHPDRAFIHHNLDAIDDQYNKLKKSSGEHNAILTKGLARAEKFQSASSCLLLWMSSTQIDIDSLQCSIADPDTVRDAIEKAKAIQLDIDSHSNDLAALCNQADCLTSNLNDEEESKTAVLTKKQTIEDRYKGLQPIVQCRLDAWEEVLPKAEKLKRRVDDMQQWLSVSEKTLEDNGMTPGDLDTINQQQQTFKALLADIDEYEREVEPLNCLVNEIAAALPEDPDQVEKALSDVNAINNRYKKLKAAAIAKHDALLDAKAKADRFQGVIGKVEQLLDEDNKILAELTLPVSLQVSEADAVVEKAKGLENQLAELQPQLKSLAAQAAALKSVSSPESAAAIDEKVGSMTEHYNQLQSQLAELLPQLSSGLEEISSFNCATDDLMKWLARKEDELCTPLVLRAVPEGVQQQLDDHKLFDDEFEVKQPDLESLQSKGQDLKEKVAPKDADILEKTLSDLKKKWDDVTHHSSERKAQLDDRLQQAQKFDIMWADTIETINDKTQQIEGMQPVGSDASTVHNQMDELQDFQESLEAIQSNVASLKVDGRHLIDACDRQDSPVIEEKLAQLDDAWDGLQSRATARQRDLEDMAIKLGQFKDTLADLLSWLMDTEGTLTSAKARLIGSDIKAIMVEIEKAEVSTYSQ